MHNTAHDNTKPDYDQVLQDIADYVLSTPIQSDLAYDTARLCLMDSLACAFLALDVPACTRLLGPIVPEAHCAGGARVPGTAYRLEPVQAAFNIGTLIRWLDFNDTWLAAEWGHPSDNLGAILAVADYVGRREHHPIQWTMRDILTAMIKAYEIQGCIALKNSFNAVGLDHVLLVKLASAAVSVQLLGGDRDWMLRVLSQVFVDGQSLRTYRHAPNTGSRKSWAAGDATARAVRLALLTELGEMGYPSALSAPKWGFYDVAFGGKPFVFERPYGCYVMENILFKIAYPAEFHAQTAIECAFQLHPLVLSRLDEISQIELETHQAAIRIISKQGPLHHPADRDHCLQYMVAVALLYGELTAAHYEAETAADPRIDKLREKMVVQEDPELTHDYLDPEKRAIGNRIRIIFSDGTQTDWQVEHYPIGHKRRRDEGLSPLWDKFSQSLKTRFSGDKQRELIDTFKDVSLLGAMKVNAFMDMCAL